MVRRSFRMGLRVGLLVGILFAVFKTVQSRRESARGPAPEPWQPIVDTPRPRPPADAPRPMTDAPQRPVDEVGEPIEEPAPDLDEEEAIEASALESSALEASAAERVEAEVAMVADEILEPAPVAKLEPLDILPDEDRPIAPVKKAAKAAKKAAKKATKRVTKKASAPAVVAPWVDPEGGICPPSHAVKAKLASKLFHLPGMFAYDRTRPDRCYVDASAAEADGFTKARR